MSDVTAEQRPFSGPNLELGTKFSTFEIAERSITAYGKLKYVHYYKRDSRTIAAAAKRISKSLNPELKYYEVKYTCIHGGRNFKTRGIGERQTKTFRQDCEAHISLRADKEGGALEIVSISDVHNHELSKELCRYLPHERKLPEDLQKTAKILMGLKCNKKMLKAHLEEASGNVVSLRDLSNLNSANKDSDPNNLTRCIKLLEEKYCADVRVLHDGAAFKGLTFCTSDMKNVIQHYPELLCVDATYKLLDIRVPVYLIVAEDGNGETEVVCVGILVEETKECLEWFVNCFKELNPNSLNVQCIMTDKDLGERNVLKAAFPNASLLICVFHTLRTFSREVTCQKMGINSVQRLAALEFFQKLTLTRSAEEFEGLMENLKDFPPKVVQYFQKNWAEIKEEWALSQGFQVCNFLNTTNNRLESLNAKLKSVVTRYSTLENFIDQFFIALQVQRKEIDHRAAMNILKRPVIAFEVDSAEYKYFQYLTQYSFEKVKKELDAVKVVKFLDYPSTAETFVNIQCGNYTVVCNASKCTCSFSTSMNLPCRHMFAVREILQLDKFGPELCAGRWHKSLYKKAQRVFLKDTSQTVGSTVCFAAPSRSRPLSEQQKFKAAMVTLKRIGSIISQSCGADYESKMEEISALADRWERDNSFPSSSRQISEEISVGEEVLIGGGQVSLSEEVSTSAAESQLHFQHSIATQDHLYAVQDRQHPQPCGSFSGENLSIEPPACTYLSHQDPHPPISMSQTHLFQQSSASTSQLINSLQLPLRIKRKGRPKGSNLTVVGLPKKRSRTLVPFINKSIVEKQKIILSFLLDADQVRRAMAGFKIDENDVECRPELIPSTILDEAIDIHQVRNCFTDDAWASVINIITIKRNNCRWFCTVCKNNILSVEAIVCDCCLQRFHLKCVSLLANPRPKFWYCRQCYS